MNRASLYQHANGLQRRDAKQILDEFSPLIKWRSGDSLLDVGCGSADVTIDFIFPLMPINFSRLVGADISEQMVRHARDNFKHPYISFINMDIGADLNTLTQNIEPFDHITSFYCLHWVQNQRKAMENIYSLLQDDGDCLLVFLANNPIFDVYLEMSQTDKWNPYMKDVRKYISPYQYSKDPETDLGNVLYAAGFKDYKIEVRERIFAYEGVENLKKAVKAVNPFVDRIPQHLHEEYFDDYIQTVIDMKLSSDQNNNEDATTTFITPYKLIICYASK